MTYAVISSIIVIITLFADDIREVAFPPSADIYFSVLNLICIGIYVVEMIVLSLIKVHTNQLRTIISSDSTSG